MTDKFQTNVPITFLTYFQYRVGNMPTFERKGGGGEVYQNENFNFPQKQTIFTNLLYNLNKLEKQLL